MKGQETCFQRNKGINTRFFGVNRGYHDGISLHATNNYDVHLQLLSIPYATTNRALPSMAISYISQLSAPMEFVVAENGSCMEIYPAICAHFPHSS